MHGDSAARVDLAACADLPVSIEHVEVSALRRPALGVAIRMTAVVHFEGGGEHGYGEEVTFQPADLLPPSPRAPWPFAGSLRELSERLRGADLFRRPPQHDVVRSYRRWAFEAAALDLALRQRGKRLEDVIGRRAQPVRFVVSPPAGFDVPPPGVRLKIEAEDLRPGLPVDIIDFKGRGDRKLVERALALYPEALLEDPPILVEDARVSWDVRIRSAQELLRLPQRPSAINVKPARLGSLASLADLYALCAEERIEVYGGGQHELGPGRGQIQVLAALFHPQQPNDVAPAAYNDAHRPVELPTSPLDIASRIGFGTSDAEPGAGG